jgi:hypothetical protein
MGTVQIQKSPNGYVIIDATKEDGPASFKSICPIQEFSTKGKLSLADAAKVLRAAPSLLAAFSFLISAFAIHRHTHSGHRNEDVVVLAVHCN